MLSKHICRNFMKKWELEQCLKGLADEKEDEREAQALEWAQEIECQLEKQISNKTSNLLLRLIE